MIFNKDSALKILILAILVSGGIYLFFHFDFHVFFADRRRLIDFIKSFGPLSVAVFIGLQILQVLFAPVPGEVTGFVGGFIFGAVAGTFYSTMGLTVGSWLAFGLARWLGLPLVEKAVNAETLKKYDYFMAHQGKLVTFILFLIPGFPKDALCYILGLSHIPVGLFLLLSASGRLLGTAMLSISGAFAQDGHYTALGLLLLISVVFCAAAFYYRDKWLHRLRHKKQAP